MKKLFIGFILIHFCLIGFGQKYMTQNGTIKFFSEAPLENIEAKNNQVAGVIDMENGNLAFSVLMKAFRFEKALMQEHFNEKYVHSDKYPKATFKGQLVDYEEQILTDEKTEVGLEGELTIHGVTNGIVSKAYLTKGEDSITGESTFTIQLADYGIKIPGAVKDNISKEIEITVKMNFVKT